MFLMFVLKNAHGGIGKEDFAEFAEVAAHEAQDRGQGVEGGSIRTDLTALEIQSVDSLSRPATCEPANCELRELRTEKATRPVQ